MFANLIHFPVRGCIDIYFIYLPIENCIIFELVNNNDDDNNHYNNFWCFSTEIQHLPRCTRKYLQSSKICDNVGKNYAENVIRWLG